MRASAVNAQYQIALLISYLITFAAYAMTVRQHQVVYQNAVLIAIVATLAAYAMTELQHQVVYTRYLLL